MKIDLARMSLLTKAWTSRSVLLCLVVLHVAALGQTQRIPGHAPTNATALQGTVRDRQTHLGVPGVRILLLRVGALVREKTTDAEGIFRFTDLPAGSYELKAEKEGFQTLDLPSFEINDAEVKDLELEPTAGATAATKGPSGVPGSAASPPAPPSSPASPYPGLPNPGLRTAETPSSPGPLGIAPEQLPPDSANFAKDPDRWNVPMPAWDRYGKGGEFPYTKRHWYDPFNRSRLKGDEPIFGRGPALVF